MFYKHYKRYQRYPWIFNIDIEPFYLQIYRHIDGHFHACPRPNLVESEFEPNYIILKHKDDLRRLI